MSKAGEAPCRHRALALAMTVQFAIGGAVMPFVGMLLRDRGFAYSEIGLLFMTSSATLMVTPFLWGMLADRYMPMNRVFAVMNGLALAALTAFAWSSHFPWVMLAFVCFQASFNPTMMLINPLCFHHLRNPSEEFGVLRSWGSVGWILPSLPIFVWLTMGQGGGLDFVLWLAMALCLAMVCITWVLPHTPPGAAKSSLADGSRIGYWKAVRQLFHDANYVVILVSFFLIAASFSLFIFYSSPRLEELGMNRAWIGPVQSLGVALEVVLFRWRRLFIHRWPYGFSLTFGCLALAVRQALFAGVESLWILSASYLLIGLVIVTFHIKASVLVNTMARLEVRATAQTMLVLCGSGLGPVVSNAIASRLTAQGNDDLRPVFWLGAGLALLAALLVASRGRKLNERPGGLRSEV